MRSSVYPLPVPVFLQGLAGVDFPHRKDPWEHAMRNTVLIGAAPYSFPDTLDFMILGWHRCAFSSQQRVKRTSVLGFLILCLNDMACFQYVIESRIVSRDRLGEL